MSERVLLDACVLYPTLLRRILMEAADRALFMPLWSSRILGEWQHAAARSGPTEAALTEGEIARLGTRFPEANTIVSPSTEARISLPDPDDAHVLAAAIDGNADSLLTLNLKDFPTRVLSANGVFRRDPDGFLLELLSVSPEAVRDSVVPQAEEAARRLGGETTPRSVLKRARLPKLGKALFSVI